MTRTTAARAASQLPDFLDEADASPGAPASVGGDGGPIDAAGATPDAPTAAAAGSRAGWLLPVACVVGAAVMAAWPAAAGAIGVAPGALLACAAAFAAAAATQGRFGGELARLAAVAHAQHVEIAALHAQVAAGGGGAHGGGDLDQVLMALQKQDDKTSNLSRAVKMYGQPLVEISGQTTEIAASMQRLEQRVDDLASRPATGATEALPQALARIEVNLAAIAQRLDDAETRKSMFRLEEATQKAVAALAELQKGDEVRRVGSELQASFGRAAASLTEAIQRLGETNLGELAVVARDIQREVTGVATQVAQINATVKNAPRLEAPPAAAPAATAAPASAAPAVETNVPSGNGGGGGYQTGARSSSGRNVLGAIARLKQMKG